MDYLYTKLKRIRTKCIFLWIMWICCTIELCNLNLRYIFALKIRWRGKCIGLNFSSVQIFNREVLRRHYMFPAFCKYSFQSKYDYVARRKKLWREFPFFYPGLHLSHNHDHCWTDQGICNVWFMIESLTKVLRSSVSSPWPNKFLWCIFGWWPLCTQHKAVCKNMPI